MSRTDSGSPAIRPAEVVRHGRRERSPDLVAVEAPLDVRLNGESFAVIMRTPGADRHLALGFLHSEGLVRTAADVTRVEHPDDDVVNVVFARGRADGVAAALASRRQVTASASCGVCGRKNVDLLGGLTPIEEHWQVTAATVDALPETLAASQSAFAETGGLHAAGVFDREGTLELIAEDVGRHNAVDKLVGAMLEGGRLPLGSALLLVSGRTSFEILQKAWRAGIPVVAAVSAPSSLAVDVARRAGITLLGFVRDGRFNVYSRPDRIIGC